MRSRRSQPILFLGADHGGFRLKTALKIALQRAGYDCRDLGALRLQPGDDYPRYARLVAQRIQSTPHSRGILVCRSGVGMVIAANRWPGVRAVQGLQLAVVERSRAEEDTNVLAIGADLTPRTNAWALVRRWLRTPFQPRPRYRRRLRQLARLGHVR